MDNLTLIICSFCKNRWLKPCFYWFSRFCIKHFLLRLTSCICCFVPTVSVCGSCFTPGCSKLFALFPLLTAYLLCSSHFVPFYYHLFTVPHIFQALVPCWSRQCVSPCHYLYSLTIRYYCETSRLVYTDPSQKSSLYRSNYTLPQKWWIVQWLASGPCVPFLFRKPLSAFRWEYRILFCFILCLGLPFHSIMLPIKHVLQ